MAVRNRIRCGEHISLDNREAFSLLRPSGCPEIVCTDGVIWVTFDGDPEDYVLKKGDRLQMGKNRNSVISAIGKAEFSLMQDDGMPATTAAQDLARTHAA